MSWLGFNMSVVCCFYYLYCSLESVYFEFIKHIYWPSVKPLTVSLLLLASISWFALT